MSRTDDDLILTPVDRLYAEVADLIRGYCARHGCKESVLGRVALNDTVFVQHVLKGGSVTTAKLRKLEAFLRADKSPDEARAAMAEA